MQAYPDIPIFKVTSTDDRMYDGPTYFETRDEAVAEAERHVAALAALDGYAHARIKTITVAEVVAEFERIHPDDYDDDGWTVADYLSALND